MCYRQKAQRNWDNFSLELQDNPKTELDENCSKMVNSFFKTDVFDTLQIEQKPGETAIFFTWSQ